MATGDSLVQGNQAQAASLGISLPGVGSGTQTANVAGNQAAAAKLGVNISGVNGAAPPPPVPQTQNAASINNNLSGGTSGTIFPPAPPAPHTNGTSANTSIPNPTPNGWDPQTYANFKAANPGLEPNSQDTANMQSGSGIATPSSIIDQGNQQTPAETANQNILQKVADLIKNKKGQTTLTNTAEAQAGIPALQKTVNDLNTQLEGLNNQATDLQNQASPGGAIQNQEQQNVLGRGVTAAGLAPQTAGDLRKNQIQQSAIASQALTLKSAIYGAQGNLTLAKDAADKAALSQYEDQQNQIDYQNALIAANLPQMNKEEKNQALLVQTQLADRQTQIQNAQDDKKTIIAMATAVLQGQPNNPQAQYAAQQALAESNKQQPDLQKVLGLIGGYQTLDTQLKVAQIASERANARKTTLETDQLGGSGNNSLLAPYIKTSYDGSQYVDVSTLSPKDKVQYTQLASQNGLKVVQTPADSDKVSHIAVAKSNLNDILNTFNSVPRDSGGIPAFQGIKNALAGAAGDPAIKAYSNYRTSAINTLQALAGGTGSGLRINQAEVNAAVKDIPILTGPNADTQEQAAAKIANLNAQLDKWGVQILGGGNTAAKDAAIPKGTDGTSYGYPGYVSDGTQWVKK